MAPPGDFIKEIELAAELLSTGAVNAILITGFKLTSKKLFPLSARLSFIVIEETWKLPGAGGVGVGSVLFEQLIKQKKKKGRR